MKKIIYLLLLISTIGYSQKSVSGFVLDNNNLPIEFANIFIQRTDLNSTVFGSTTNADGSFNILLDNSNTKNEYEIVVSFIGFEPWSKKIIINKTIHFDKIILKEDTTKLNEIIITSKIKTITKKKDKIIFNVQNSPLKSGYSGVELLKNTPTVWVDSNENILIRNEPATILINGKKVNMKGEDLSNYLSNLNSDVIKNIVIQTNKGADTQATSTGGIINFILKEKQIGFKSQINFRYDYKGDDYFTLFPGINTSYGTEKWNLYGSYNLGLKNDFSEVTNTIFFDTQNQENKSVRAKETKTLRHSFQLGFVNKINKNHDIGMEVFGNFNAIEKSDLGNSFYVTENILTDNGINNILSNSNKNNINSILNYSWKISPKDKLKMFVDFAFNKSDDDSNVTTTYEENTFDDNLIKYKSDTKTFIYAFQTDYNKTLKNDATFDLGIKYTYSDRDNTLLPQIFENPDFEIITNQLADFNYQENVFASYLSFDKNITDKNYFKVGVRVENTNINKVNNIDNSDIKQNYTSYFPSIYYSRKLSSKGKLSLGYYRSLKRPSFRDLNNDIIKINDFQFVLGNPDLQPEFIDKYELNYQISKNNITLYYNKTNDAINGVYFLEDNVAFYKKINAGSQVQLGLEYSTSKKVKKWWYLNFSSYLFNRKFINEQNKSMFEKTTLGVKFYNNFKLNKTASINLSGKYISPKSDAFYEASEYYSVDVGIKKTFFSKKLSLRIGLKDVFNSLEYRNRRIFNNFETFTKLNPKSRFVKLRLTYNLSNSKKILKKKNKSKNENSKRL